MLKSKLIRRVFFFLILLLQCLFARAQAWEALNEKIMTLSENKEYDKGIPLAQKALEFAKNEFGAGSVEYVASLNNLATLYKFTGRLAEAEPLMLTCNDILKQIPGAEENDRLTILNNLGELYEQMQEYHKAAPFYIQAADIYARYKNDFIADYINALSRLSELYAKTGETGKEESIYLKQMEAYRTVTNRRDTNYSTLLMSLGNFYSATGQYKKAIPLLYESKGIAMKYAGIKSELYAVALNGLGLLYINMNRYDSSILFLNESLQIRQQLGDTSSTGYATATFNLGLAYSDLSSYADAQKMYLHAGKIFKDINGEHSLEYSNCLNALFEIYKAKGDFGRAKELQLQAIRIMEMLNQNNTYQYAAYCMNMGGVYQEMGDYSNAESYILKGSKILLSLFGEKHASYSESLNALANLYSEMGQYERALSAFTEASAILKNELGENNLRYATSINNVAALTTDTRQALLLYEKAIGIIKNISGENNLHYLNKAGNLSEVYLRNGDYSKAYALMQKAKNISAGLFGENSIDYAYRIRSFGNYYEITGDRKAAEQFYLKALSIAGKLIDTNNVAFANYLECLADLYTSEKKYRQSKEILVRVNEIRINSLRNTLPVLSEWEKLSFINDNTLSLQNMNGLMFCSNSRADDIGLRNFNQLLQLKGLALDDSRRMLAYVRSSADSALMDDYEKWKLGKSALARLYALNNEADADNRSYIETGVEQLEKDMGRKFAGVKNILQNAAITADSLRASMSNEEAIIEFVDFNDIGAASGDSLLYAAYVLRKTDSFPLFIPLCSEYALNAIVGTSETSTNETVVKQIYRGTEKLNKQVQKSKELYNLIWQPIEPYLNGVKTISLAPSGKLYNIAFHALRTDSATLLMDKYTFHLYNSTREKVEEKYYSKPANNIVLFGNPDYSLAFTSSATEQTNSSTSSFNISAINRTGKNKSLWQPLPGTLEEVQNIQKIFAQKKLKANVYTGAAASEENLKKLSGNSPAILHIATHGFAFAKDSTIRLMNGNEKKSSFFISDNPLWRTGLILAGANNAWLGNELPPGIEDGILTSFEIAQLDLSNTELVVLSACETGLGEVSASEGVFGLQRAFKQAGVQNIMVSLWPVPDKETSEMMSCFYESRLSGTPINEALNVAREKMRKKYPPYYWAAFTLIE